MKPAFEYKGYQGSAEVSVADDMLHGKILFINDIVTFAAKTPAELEQAFRDSVDDYLATCQEIGDEPDTPFKGTFNVRIGPERHKRAAMEAARLEIKLNDWIVRAVDAFTDPHPVMKHHVSVQFIAPDASFKTFVSTASQAPDWQGVCYGRH